MIRKLLSLLLAASLLFQGSAYADTFIVTSNADSGPGTLREAITLANANGTAVTDYIHFNIPDLTEIGRTITLQSALPALSPKIVIDGSTQPGVKFGVSDSKIKLTHSGNQSFSQGLILSDTEDIEIYGIYFTNFRFGDPNLVEIRCAIYMPGKIKNVRIGAPGKGNLFYDNPIGIANRYSWTSNPGDRITDMTLQANFFGLREDGVTVQSVGPAFIIRSFKNLTIGGDTEAEGNYFASSWNGSVGSILSDTAANNGFITVRNNTFGANFSKTASVPCGTLEIAGDNSGSNNVYADAVVSILNNSFNSCYSMMTISSIRGFLTIQGNTIGNLAPVFSCQNVGFGIFNCKDGIIGGDQPIEKNSIARNSTYGIALNNDSNITIKKNSIYCNGKGINATSNKVTIPFVRINSTNETDFVSGTATPNCHIEVFQNFNPCSACTNGEIFLGETTSDNSGNWSFTAPFSSAVTATATTSPGGVTGEFSEAKFNAQNLVVTNPVCNMNNGSITGMQFISGTRYYWVKNNVDTFFNQLDLLNIGAGSYKFIIEQTKYCKKEYSANLFDNSPKINAQSLSTQHPSCGLFNGKIIGAFITGAYNKIYWLSQNRDTAGTSIDLVNVGPGNYKLIVLNITYGCGDSTNWITLTNQAGPFLNTNNIQIISATCNNPNGSIAGINSDNVTGTPFIQWLDSLNNIVGNTLDLLNQPAGKYKLKFKDQSGCDTIITPFYIIPSTGRISIDTSGKIITKAGCTVNNGSIRNIKVIGADSYQWQNLTTNIAAGSTADIYNLSPGNYQLTATNAMGCSAISPVINVPQSSFIPIGVTGTQTRIAVCGENNGFIRVTSFNNDSNLYSFRWIDSTSNQLLATGTALYNIGAGTYLLMATDSNGCEKQITKTVLGAFPKPVFDFSGMLIKNDKCSSGEGSIKGIKATGFPPQLPVTYSWKNAGNSIVGTSPDLINIPAGQYYLTVTDGILCTIQSSLFTITNIDDPGIILQYDNPVIPRNTSATMTIKNFQPGEYFLYSDPAGTQLLQQNTTGNFITDVLNADADYYIKFISGTCVSSIAHVKIAVVDKSFFAIASGFSPNHDGINDRLNLKVIGFIDVEYFRIFNRNGEQVFFTKTINDGWDGKYKGNEQPTGVFVWLAKGKDIHGKTISGKGTFLLMK